MMVLAYAVGYLAGAVTVGIFLGRFIREGRR
jgi:glycerol-3-phosphate acyltransferase PlsY